MSSSKPPRPNTPKSMSAEVQNYLLTYMPIITDALTEMSLKRPKDPHVCCNTLHPIFEIFIWTRDLTVSNNACVRALGVTCCIVLTAQAFLAQYLLSQSNYPNAADTCAAILKHAGVPVGEPDHPAAVVQARRRSSLAKKEALQEHVKQAEQKVEEHHHEQHQQHHHKKEKHAAGGLKIIIAGAPCSGKGTQCEMIKDKYGVYHLSTGDLLRAEIQAQSELGLKAKEYMDHGNLVPDSLIIDIVKDKLNSEEVQKSGWLLDGFPRTAAQAQALQDAGIHADIFLQLHVPDEVLIKRVTGRRLDQATGRTYHIEYDPPPPELPVVQRADDTEEKIVTRLHAYHTAIQAIQEQYKDVKLDLDGDRKKQQITEDIITALDALVSKAL